MSGTIRIQVTGADRLPRKGGRSDMLGGVMPLAWYATISRQNG
jgi:hypothetical protein